MTRTLRFLRYTVWGITEHPRRKPRKRAVARGPVRDWKYRVWIRSLPCAACGCTRFIEAAHTGTDGGMRLKSSDHSCVPLCAVCHRVGPRAFHQIGRQHFEQIWNLDFDKLAARLYGLWVRGREDWE